MELQRVVGPLTGEEFRYEMCLLGFQNINPLTAKDKYIRRDTVFASAVAREKNCYKIIKKPLSLEANRQKSSFKVIV